MKALEYLAVLSGVAYVLLAARGQVWCWICGIISSAIYIYLNLEWQLYYDATLQFFYVLFGIYGWIQWNKGKSEVLSVQYINAKKQLQYAMYGLPLSVVLGYATYLYLNTPFTYIDAGVTVFSLIATYLTAKKVLQSWIWWILIDLCATGLYVDKEAYVTALLYIVYALAAAYGYYTWKKQIPTSV